jgi:hypothetical protein
MTRMGHPQPMQTRGTRVVPTRGLRVYTRHGTGTGRVFNTGGKTRAIAYAEEVEECVHHLVHPV